MKIIEKIKPYKFWFLSLFKKGIKSPKTPKIPVIIPREITPLDLRFEEN